MDGLSHAPDGIHVKHLLQIMWHLIQMHKYICIKCILPEENNFKNLIYSFTQIVNQKKDQK